MAGLFNFTAEKPQQKLSRGRLTQQGKDFLRTLSWYDADDVQKLYYDKFGVTYKKGTLLKYVPSQPVTSSISVSSQQHFSEGTIEVDGAGLRVTDNNGNTAMIELDLFTPKVVQQLSSQILYQLEDELTEEETIVEKLRAKIEAIKTLAGA